MKKITIKFPDNTSIQVENEICPLTLMKHFGDNGQKIMAVKVNNEVQPLDTVVDINAYLEPVYENTKEGAAIYRRSLCFLLAAAAHKLFPDSRLLVGHSLGYGYYYTIDKDSPLTPENIARLKEEMLSIVKDDRLIEPDFISYEDACTLLETLRLVESRKQLNYRAAAKIKINRLDDFADIYFGPLVSSTSELNVFDLMPYHEGFLLRFPKHSEPDRLPDFVDEPKLFEIYSKYKKWGKRLGVTSAGSLNQLIHDRKVNEFIDITETLQVKCIADIADQIKNRKSVRVVLIAGPSYLEKPRRAKSLPSSSRPLDTRRR